MPEASGPRRLGLIGGLGVGATIHYYQALVRAHAARGAAADMLISHAHMPRVRAFVEAGDLDGLADYLGQHIARLAQAGAEVAAISAVAPHICAPKLASISALPLVDIVDALNETLRARGLRRVALLGTRFAMETGLFGRLRGVELVKLSAAETELVHAAYMRIAETGAGAAEDVAALRGIARRLIAEEAADCVVLAGTDLSVAFNEETAGFPAIDSTRVHVEAVMRRLFDAPA
jgi:aspartate racemase